MTSTAARKVSARSPLRARTVLLAPFGHYTRYILRSYLVHIFIVAVALVSVSLTVDLSPWVWSVYSGENGAGQSPSLARLGWFVGLRAADILAQVMPIAVFIGVLWSEVVHTWSRERLMVSNTGRSPLQCLVPVALLGALMFFAQFALDAYLRPAAVMTLASEKLGEYGRVFDRSLTPSRLWLSAGDDVIHARVRYGPGPVLRDVTVYRLTADNQVGEVINAESALPVQIMGRTVWMFYSGSRWTAPLRTGARGHPEQPSPADGRFERAIASLELDANWLPYSGIHAKYLPQASLKALARGDGRAFPTSEYRTWVQARYAQAALPGLLALLATSLSLLLIAGEARFLAFLFIATAGYLGTVLMKVLTIFGEHGLFGPVLATWTAPVLLLAASGVALYMVAGQARGNGPAAAEYA